MAHRLIMITSDSLNLILAHPFKYLVSFTTFGDEIPNVDKAMVGMIKIEFLEKSSVLRQGCNYVMHLRLLAISSRCTH